MSKLRLELDELRVESFEPEAPARHAAGTVHAQATDALSGCGSCDGGFTCNMDTCEPVSNCQNTANRCPLSYHPTCIPRCQTGMDC